MENKLFRVTMEVKKLWMDKYLEFEWAVISTTPDNAIQKILNMFDLSGIDIKSSKAQEEEYIIVK